MNDTPRTVPERVRITKLQEAQLQALERIERECVQMYYDIGVSPEVLKPRNQMLIGGLTRTHDVLVAEADHEPAGYLVWADEAPGVAHIKWLAVAPAYQRFGIATQLLREVAAKANQFGIELAAFSLIEGGAWARAFLSSRGFAPVAGDDLPSTMTRWHKQHAAQLDEDGLSVWWRVCAGLGTIAGLPQP